MFFEGFTKFVHSFRQIGKDYIVYAVDFGEFEDLNVKLELGIFDKPELLGMGAKMISEPIEILVSKEWFGEQYSKQMGA